MGHCLICAPQSLASNFPRLLGDPTGETWVGSFGDHASGSGHSNFSPVWVLELDQMEQ